MTARSIARVLFIVILCTGPISADEPRLAFEAMHLEVTVEPGAKEAPISFPFINLDSKAVEVERAKAPCTCLNVHFQNDQMTYQAGQSGALMATLTVGNLSGTMDKEILVWLKGDEVNRPSYKLTVTMKIPELITMEPKSLKWTSGEPPTPKIYQITVHQAKPIRITATSASNPVFETQLSTVIEGKKYQLTVTPKETGKTVFGTIKITSDCKIERFSSISGYAVIK